MRRAGDQLLAGFRIDQHSLNLHVDAVERFPQGFRQIFGRFLAQHGLQANLKNVNDALGIHLINFILVEPAVNHIGKARADEPQGGDIGIHPNAQDCALGAVAPCDNAVFIHMREIRRR